MNLVTPNLENVSGAKVVVNSLYDCQDPGFLVQDLLLVELPGKTYIDVSWFPEHDPAGAYIVSVFRGHNQLADLETKSPHDAIRIVERWAAILSRPVANLGCPFVQFMRGSPDPFGSAEGVKYVRSDVKYVPSLVVESTCQLPTA